MADWDTNSPGNSDIISQYPPNERNARAAARTNFGVDHHEEDDADVGKHEQVTLLEQSSDPASASNQARLFAKAAADGTTQLFVIDSAGVVSPLSPVDTGSFSITGAFSATGRYIAERGDGGNWVTLYIPYMTHSAAVSADSQAGAVPAAYRPSSDDNVLEQGYLGADPANNDYAFLAVSSGGLLSFSYWRDALSGSAPATVDNVVSASSNGTLRMIPALATDPALGSSDSVGSIEDAEIQGTADLSSGGSIIANTRSRTNTGKSWTVKYFVPDS